MEIQQKLKLLGGLAPEQFMRRHWQKKPLLIRQAFDPADPRLQLSRAALLLLAQMEAVQSRLVMRQGQDWELRHGPHSRKSLPPLAQPGWTLLVQGVDLHYQPLHQLLAEFRFVPDARLDDVMVSYATDGGGVGPHFDSYDVFLLQASGQRKWDISAQKDLSLQPDMPLKILQNFAVEQSFVLDAGDMLYLPPRYAHNGVAQGECVTYSVGFRAPSRDELAQELLGRVAEQAAGTDTSASAYYRDPTQTAVTEPAAIPSAMQDFAQQALQRLLQDPRSIHLALGEYLTEPKPNVWFETAELAQLQAAAATDGDGDGGLTLQAQAPAGPAKLMLDRRTRMMYDEQHIYINGEAFRTSGRDATLIRSLADQRSLPPAQRAKLSTEAAQLLRDWQQAGWLHEQH